MVTGVEHNTKRLLFRQLMDIQRLVKNAISMLENLKTVQFQLKFHDEMVCEVV